MNLVYNLFLLTSLPLFLPLVFILEYFQFFTRNLFRFHADFYSALPK